MGADLLKCGRQLHNRGSTTSNTQCHSSVCLNSCNAQLRVLFQGPEGLSVGFQQCKKETAHLKPPKQATENKVDTKQRV